MSVELGLVGAETFAAVNPKNNEKLAKDMQKLRSFPHRFRWAFFYSPGFVPGRDERLECDAGADVHCVGV